MADLNELKEAIGEDVEITEETLAELSNGKGDEE